VLGATYARVYADLSDLTVDREFSNGYFSFQLTNVLAGDNVVSVTLPAGSVPDQFFNYGPTPEDNNPHWYEFNFDGVTGAEINGNIINLHYTDGLRGDSDLTQDGIITVAVGGAARITGDGDGIADDVEDGAPNKGDGNGDGIPDKQQVNVTSLVDVVNGQYVTVEAETGLFLKNLSIIESANIIFQSGAGSELNGLNFTHGFLRYEVKGLDPGSDTKVKLFLDTPGRPVRYFKFGPTPDNPVDHLYEFDFDGETGAEINGNVITLHFVDGKRGDSDLTADGVITDPGTPAIRASNTGESSGGGSGGGCSINNSSAAIGKAGSWFLIGMFVLSLGIYRRFVF
jgi:hypothetical protein